jgi:fructose-specific phosphotransferase system IIA component
MNLSEMFDDSRIIVNFEASDKKEVLGKLIDMVVNGYDRDQLLEAIYEREELGSTGIGYGVAVPHIRMDDVTTPVVAFGKSASPVDFDAMDDEPCSLFFLIVGPTQADSQNLYLKVMAKISRLMRNKSIRDELNAAQSADDVKRVISENELS